MLSARSLSELITIKVLIKPNKCSAASHSEGAASVLKHRGFHGPDDIFERILLLTLRGPVVGPSSVTLEIYITNYGKIFEALWNDNIQLSQREWRDLVLSKLDNSTVVTAWLTYLATVPDLRRRCMYAMRYASTMSSPSLTELALETKKTLERCGTDIIELRERLNGMTGSLYVDRLRSLSMALFTGIIFSCMYHALSCRPLSSDSEVAQWSREMLQLAYVAIKYRPLGSMTMIFCLEVAWVGAADELVRGEIKARLLEYHRECMGQLTEAELTESLGFTARRFLLRDVACNRLPSR